MIISGGKGKKYFLPQVKIRKYLINLFFEFEKFHNGL